MRPIVSCFGSPTYELSKYLTTILKPLTDKSNHKLQYIEDFIDTIKTIQIPHDYKLVSFDVKSLFTSIPLQLALQCTETAIERYTTTVTLPAQDIMELLNLCLTSTYFQFNGKHYKQLHGTAMGSPVSVIVAEIVMQAIEERALATYQKHYRFGYATLTTHSLQYTKTRLTPYTNTSTNRTLTYSLRKRSKRMERFLF